jgi:hypothetical protein
VRQKAYLLAALADFCVVADGPGSLDEDEEAEEEEGDVAGSSGNLKAHDLFVHAPSSSPKARRPSGSSSASSGSSPTGDSDGGWIATLKSRWRQQHHGHAHGGASGGSPRHHHRPSQVCEFGVLFENGRED